MQLIKICRLFFAAILLFPTLVFSTSTTIKADIIYHPRPASNLHWHPCKDGLPGTDCALFTVPLDYAHPSNGTIKIGISRFKALNPHQRIGTLFVNAGGPGSPGDNGLRMVGIESADKKHPLSSFFQHLVRDTVPLHQHFDIIGFDPRGIGRGTQLNCPVNLPAPQIPFPPTNEKEYKALLTYNHTLGLDCEHQVGPLIDHVDTESVVNDTDNIRKALGEKTISFLGGSYGTEIGQLYAEKYPTHLRATVLDSNVNHADVNLWTIPYHSALAEEKTLQYYNHMCQSSPYCKIAGKNIIANFTILIKEAQQGRLHDSHGLKIPPDNISNALIDSLIHAMDPNNFSTINLIFSHTQKAYDFLAKQSSYNEPLTQAEIFTQSVWCHDFIPKGPFPTFAQYNQEIKRIKAVAPHFWRTPNMLDDTLGCFDWPIPAQNPPTPLHIPANVPILLLTNKADPATAPAFSVALHKEIPDSRLIITNSIGHGAVMNSHCGRIAEVHYLLTAQLPWFDEHCSG